MEWRDAFVQVKAELQQQPYNFAEVGYPCEEGSLYLTHILTFVVYQAAIDKAFPAGWITLNNRFKTR